SLSGTWETNNAVLNDLSEIIQYDLDDDYFRNFDAEVRNLTVAQVRDLSRMMVRPNDIVYFVVGDEAKILPKLKELNVEIVRLDADGNVKAKKDANP
ncbi:MAG: hypothetical protein R3350_08750, partial [Saprospiraceae bacterium]|nr:hypothetical protein [Saprospiraceae bacterium]